MITYDIVLVQVPGLRRDDLDCWIGNDWLRPGGSPPAYLFGEIDVARARLILQLRDEMEVNETAIPIVLSLLDQLYALRRSHIELAAALQAVAPEQVRRDLAGHLSRRG